MLSSGLPAARFPGLWSVKICLQHKVPSLTWVPFPEPGPPSTNTTSLRSIIVGVAPVYPGEKACTSQNPKHRLRIHPRTGCDLAAFGGRSRRVYVPLRPSLKLRSFGVSSTNAWLILHTRSVTRSRRKNEPASLVQRCWFRRRVRCSV